MNLNWGALESLGLLGSVAKVGIAPLECARLDLGLGGLSIGKTLAWHPTHASVAGHEAHHTQSICPSK